MTDNTANPYAAALAEGRAMTENELAIDWARLKIENGMLMLETAVLRQLHRRVLIAFATTFCLFVLQTVHMVWCLTR